MKAGTKAREKVLTYVIHPTKGLGVACKVYENLPGTARGLQNAYPCDPRKFLNTAAVLNLRSDHRRILLRLVMSQVRSGIILHGVEGCAIIQEMVATGRCFWTKDGRAPLTWGRTRPALAVWREVSGGSHRPGWTITPHSDIILPVTPPVYLDLKNLYCGTLDTDLPEAMAARWSAGEPMNQETSAKFCGDLAHWFPEVDVPVPGTIPVELVSDLTPTPCLTVCRREFAPESTLTGASVSILFIRPEFDYGGKRIHAATKGSLVNIVGDEKIRKVKRCRKIEKAAMERLRDLQFVRLQVLLRDHCLGDCGPDLALDPQGDRDWGHVLQDVLPALEGEGWRVEYDSNLELVSVEQDAWYSEMESTGIDWFSFEAGIRVNGHKINVLPAVHSFLQKHRRDPLSKIEEGLRGRTITVEAGQGTIALISGDRFFQILRNLFELFQEKPLRDDNRLQLSAWRVAEIGELERISSSSWNIPEKLQELSRKLRAGFTLDEQEPPAALNGKLRPYQKVGLRWIQFLREHELCGMLADDMGLGKTIQALSHLLTEKEAGRLDGPSLVVAPTSVVGNWVDECRRFAPGLSVLLLQGGERKQEFDKIDGADVVVTSYALLRRDAEIHLAKRYCFAILDEAQFIKNHRAQVARVAANLPCRSRLALTGTPMENHLGELWALMTWLMPGFLGSLKAFTTQFRRPIEREGDENLRMILNRRVAPFLLRRGKDEVERDLPRKTETIHAIPLSDRQHDIYETVRLAMESRVRHEIARRGIGRSSIVILDALLKLRLTCCDPRLVDKEGEAGAADSCKLNALMSMLPQMIEEGRRVLLFSQFTKMLALIERELERSAIDYVKLTGSTRKRQDVIRRFQEGEVPLFLISLKAGGTGLNLTAADSVIHFDPWWNPAVEKQATDRAHRIGQSKPVFVYKLLTENTVEAKILELQKRKKELAAGILTEQKAGKISFDKNDLAHLFAPIE